MVSGFASSATARANPHARMDHGWRSMTFDDLKTAVADGDDRHRARLHRRHAGPPDGQALRRRAFCRQAPGTKPTAATTCWQPTWRWRPRTATPPPAGNGATATTSMKPDLSTLRPVPWLEGTALVLCDVLDHHSHEPVTGMRRARSSNGRSCGCAEMGLSPTMATELEFFLFEKSFEEAHAPQERLPRSRT